MAATWGSPGITRSTCGTLQSCVVHFERSTLIGNCLLGHTTNRSAKPLRFAGRFLSEAKHIPEKLVAYSFEGQAAGRPLIFSLPAVDETQPQSVLASGAVPR